MMLPNLALIEPLQAREAVRTTDSIRLFPPSATAGSFDSGEINFTGQRRDANTGLGFYNARYYDSEIGRFISADSIVPGEGRGDSFNRYAYVRNNPLKYIDPTGNHDEEICYWYRVDEGQGSGRVERCTMTVHSHPVVTVAENEPDPFKAMPNPGVPGTTQEIEHRGPVTPARNNGRSVSVEGAVGFSFGVAAIEVVEPFNGVDDAEIQSRSQIGIPGPSARVTFEFGGTGEFKLYEEQIDTLGIFHWGTRIYENGEEHTVIGFNNPTASITFLSAKYARGIIPDWDALAVSP